MASVIDMMWPNPTELRWWARGWSDREETLAADHGWKVVILSMILWLSGFLAGMFL